MNIRNELFANFEALEHNLFSMVLRTKNVEMGVLGIVREHEKGFSKAANIHISFFREFQLYVQRRFGNSRAVAKAPQVGDSPTWKTKMRKKTKQFEEN